MKKKPLVACLARTSTEMQHTSIDNQHEIFYRWIEKNDSELFDIYTDEGISGTKGIKRIEWLRMIEDAKDRKFNVLLAKSFSRFGRNQRETLDAIATLRTNGIRIVFIENNLDSEQDATKFGLFAWLAEQEAQQTSTRLKEIWKHYNQIGKVHVTLASYGYDYDENIKNFVINHLEANIVTKIFNLYTQGFGFNKIAKILSDEGVKTKRGGVWAGQTISGILENEFYCGTLIQGKKRTIDVTLNKVEDIEEEEWIKHYNNHEAIIDEETFVRVLKQKQERSGYAKTKYTKEHSNSGNQRTRQSNASLFSNLLKCGDCGSTMSIKRKKMFDFKPFYNCIKYDMYGKKECGHSSNFIWEENLLSMLKSELDDLVKDNYKTIKDKISQKVEKMKPKTVEKELEIINAKIEQHIKLSTSLLVNYTNGIMGQTQFKLQNESIEQNLNILMARKQELENIPEIDINIKNEKYLIKDIETLMELPIEEWNNAMLKAILDSITVFIGGRIEFNFKYLNSQLCNVNTYR